MKIAYIFRERKDTPPSIENVFNNLGHLLNENGHKIVYYTLPNKSRLLQIIHVLKFYFKHKNDIDVFHVTGDVHWVSLLLPKSKTLLTIHDFSPYDNNSFPSNWLLKIIYKTFWFDLPISYLRKIHLISNTTLKRGTNYFPKLLTKGFTIYNSIQPNLRKKDDYNNLTFSILQIGTHENKNLELLIESAIKLKDLIHIELNIVGKLTQEIIDKLSLNKLKYNSYINISKEELNEVYLNSDILFFASLYEGFGLPIIEAQTFGLPVITSNIDICKEVGGDAAIYIDNTSSEGGAEAILRLYRDEKLFKEQIEKGFNNVKRFSPDNIREQFEIIYKKIIDEKDI